jgi:hypothetical protein
VPLLRTGQRTAERSEKAQVTVRAMVTGNVQSVSSPVPVQELQTAADEFVELALSTVEVRRTATETGLGTVAAARGAGRGAATVLHRV